MVMAPTAAPGQNSDRLNLLHIALLLRTVSTEAGTQYDVLEENCFWFTWAVRASIRSLTRDNPELGIGEFTERPCCGIFAMSTCFGFLAGRPTDGQLDNIHRAFLTAYTNCQDEASLSCIHSEGPILNSRHS